ncbi:MAG: N-acetyl-gamma-glutamyl-phosphate reductase [Paracoccaceae bacterium]
MVWSVFIDGEVGTTGLQIRDRLAPRPDIRLISLDETRRKDAGARAEAYGEADVAILCLPDDAAREAAALAAGLPVRLIDASTAHRVDPDWVFGFAEMAKDQRAAIAGAKRVSNPGCWSTGAIGLLAPLVAAGLVAADEALAISGVSGYTGGGKAMIAEFASGATTGSFMYATGQHHKHLPEIQRYAGLSRRPAFLPSVGDYDQGMVVQVALPLGAGRSLATLHGALADHYAGGGFVSVVGADHYGARIHPQALNGTNRLELSVHGDDALGVAVLVAVLDNLGKGASGAAVQNLNIMLGVDEVTGL